MAQRESRLSRRIIKELKLRGGFWFKIWGNEHMMAGLPDIVGCYRGRFVAFETKNPEKRSNMSVRQEYVHGLIKKAGGVVEVIVTPEEALGHIDRVDAMIKRGR